MINYKTIYETAVILNPDLDLENNLPQADSNKSLKSKTDAWYLSTMSRRIFRAGLKHSMVDKKWPDFEQAFHNFDLMRVSMMSDEDMDALMTNRRLIRHWRKIQAVRFNASVMMEMLDEYGGFGQYLANWPVHNTVGLWQELKKHYKQMGGNSAPYFLRMSGRDTFILTGDVIRALNRWGGYQGIPSTIKGKRQVQEIFNSLADQSGRPLCELSRILALSVNE